MDFTRTPVTKLDVLNLIAEQIKTNSQQYENVCEFVLSKGYTYSEVSSNIVECINSGETEDIIINDEEYFILPIVGDEFFASTQVVDDLHQVLDGKTMSVVDVINNNTKVFQLSKETFNNDEDCTYHMTINGVSKPFFGVWNGDVVVGTEYRELNSAILESFHQTSNKSVDDNTILETINVFNESINGEVTVDRFKNLYDLAPTTIKDSNSGIILTNIITDARSFDSDTIMDSVSDSILNLYTKVKEACDNEEISFDTNNYDPVTSFTGVLPAIVTTIAPILQAIGTVVGGIIGIATYAVGLVAKTVMDFIDMRDLEHGSFIPKKADSYVYAKPFIQQKTNLYVGTQYYQFFKNVMNTAGLAAGRVYKMSIGPTVFYFWSLKDDVGLGSIYIEGKLSIRWSPIGKFYANYLLGTPLVQPQSFPSLKLLTGCFESIWAPLINGYKQVVANDFFDKSDGQGYYLHDDLRCGMLNNGNGADSEVYQTRPLRKLIEFFTMNDQEMEAIASQDADDPVINSILLGITMDSVALFTCFFNGYNSGQGFLMPNFTNMTILIDHNDDSEYLFPKFYLWDKDHNYYDGTGVYNPVMYMYGLAHAVENHWSSFASGNRSAFYSIKTNWFDNCPTLVDPWVGINTLLKKLYDNYVLDSFSSYLNYLLNWDYDVTWNKSFNKIRYYIHTDLDTYGPDPTLGLNLTSVCGNKCNGCMYPAKWSEVAFAVFWLTIGAITLAATAIFVGAKIFQAKMKKKAWAATARADMIAFGETNYDVNTPEGQKAWYKQWRKTSRTAGFYNFISGNTNNENVPDGNDTLLKGVQTLISLIK